MTINETRWIMWRRRLWFPAVRVEQMSSSRSQKCRVETGVPARRDLAGGEQVFRFHELLLST